MSNPDDPITIALRDLADQAAPPRISVDDAWRAGRRRRRFRRQIPATAAALTVAAGAALAVTSMAAPGHPITAQLTAWTVVKKPGGAVQVTIREMRDPAGLQRRLRADGVPANVRFDSNPPLPSQLPRPCLNYQPPDRESTPLLERESTRLLERIFPQSGLGKGQTAFTVNPSAIPARVGLWINVSPPARQGPGSTVFSADFRLVYASGRCPSGKAAIPPGGAFVIGGLSGGK
jgi:hypothetical protein